MSRIGNAPVVLSKEITLTLTDHSVTVKGVKGELSFQIPARMKVTQDGETLIVSRLGNDTASRALHGFVRSELANNVVGVTKGWSKTLELSGVGYRASMSGANLVITVGFSHPVTIVPASGISFAVADVGKIIVSGINKQQVGQVAATIHAIKKPEPYKGKGIKYEGEIIRKKAGKAKSVGGAPGAK